LTIGRYGITFRSMAQLQAKAPMRIWHFLWFWFFKEARPHDVDKKQQFLLGTPMEHKGWSYRYWKAGEDIGKDRYVAIQGNASKGVESETRGSHRNS